jgi:hypothetical protein
VLPRDHGPVGERPHLVGYLRVHRGRQVMPDPGQDDEPGATDRRGGAPRGGEAQQRIPRAVQYQGWHAELGQPAASSCSSTSWPRWPRTPPAWPPSWKPSASSTPPPHCSCRTSSAVVQPGSSATPPTCTTPWLPAATPGSRNCSHRPHQPRRARPKQPLSLPAATATSSRAS